MLGRVLYEFERNTEDGIPSLKQRKQARRIDRRRYRQRNLVERFVNQIKHFRRIFTPYERRLETSSALFTLRRCDAGSTEYERDHSLLLGVRRCITVAGNFADLVDLSATFKHHLIDVLALRLHVWRNCVIRMFSAAA